MARRPRVWGVILLALLLALPIGYAKRERAVEGHTVFMTLQTGQTFRGFDIVVLVRDHERGPNVLWFNDQWKTFSERIRYPCGGYVFVTRPGVNPFVLLDLTNATGIGLALRYKESYWITDPNGYTSRTHLYSFLGPRGTTSDVLVASVHDAWVADDGRSHCAPVLDLASARDPGFHGLPYHDNVDGVPVREYNADVFGRYPFGQSAGSKQHGPGQAHEFDGTGCEVGTEWECGPTGDDAEGNSHPYNPNEAHAGWPHAHGASLVDVHFASELTDLQKRAFDRAGGLPPSRPRYWIQDTNAVEPGASVCWIDGGYHDHC